jgi:peptide/nickel transport system substrate-binding protein
MIGYNALITAWLSINFAQKEEKIMRIRKYPLLALCLAVVLMLSYSGAAKAQDNKNTLIVATRLSDVITLDPGRAFETLNLTVHHATYETLLEIKANDLTKIVPGLAESYKLSDDGLTYTFVLNKAAKFASGNPVTAEDVRFSWTRLKNIKGGPSSYVTDSGVDKIEVVDPQTVKVTLKAAYPAFATIVTAPAMSILDSKLVKEHGGTDAEDADKSDQAKEWLDQNSAGSGQFILKKWTPNAEVVMVRNDNYWKTKALVDGVTLKDVKDNSSAYQLLSRNDVDIAEGVDADIAAQAKSNSDVKLSLGQSLNLTYLAVSPDPSFNLPTSNQKVRQAIAYAIDYDGIIQGLTQGYADRPAAMLPVGVQGSDPSKRYTHNLDKAKALLKEAGVENGFEITLSIGQGQSSGVPREVLAAKIQSDLAEVGIKVKIDQQTSTNFLTAFRAQKLPMVISTWTPDYLDATMWSDFFSKPDGGVAKRIKMNIPAIAEIATKAGNERDAQKRMEFYALYQSAQVDAAVFIPLIQEQYIDLVRSTISGYVFHPVYFMDFSTVKK